MDKGHNTRPYDDLNSIVTEKEDEEMEDGEKGEGEGNQPPAPMIPPQGSRPNRMAHLFQPNQGGAMPHIHPNLPPPPPGLSNIFSNLNSSPNLNINNFHPLHDTTSHENLPPTFGPPMPSHIPRLGESTVVKQFDFRHNKMPEGVTIIGEGNLEEQQDKSTALVLGPKSCLNLNLGFTTPPGDHKFVNNYTITMDIKVDSLPHDSLSLYQANLITRPSEGECYISKTGGVGIFGEYGVRESWIKEKKWTRVVIALGGRFGGEYRRMTTYVNGKVCASINKGVLQAPDGRFGLSPECVLLFGSITESFMPGIRVRYVEVRPKCLTNEEVREMTYLNRVYSFWEAEEQQAQRRVFENMSLQPLYKRPPPIWLSPAFLGEFGDAFLEGTGLEGGSIPPVIAAYSLALDGALQDQKEFFNGFEHEDFQKLDAINEIFKDAKSLARQWGLVLQNGAQQFPHFLRKLSKLMIALKEGEFILVPGGIGGASLMYIVERVTPETCRFVVVNTDPHSGLEYHESHAQRPGKLMYKTCMALDNIPVAKVLDDALWACLLKLQVYPSKQNTPDKVYDLLLPFLTQKPLEAAMVECSNDATIDWRSPQRAGMAYFRVILESLHYLMRRKGISVEKAKQMTFIMRLQMISMANNDLHFERSVTGSDARLIRMACEQLAYTSLKISNHSTPASTKLTDAQLVEIKRRVDEIDAAVAALPNDDANSTDPPPPVDLEDGNRFDYQHALHPFFDRLLREEDVDGLAGAPIRLPKYVPVDVLQVPARVNNFEDALAAIRFCDKMCTLISVQAHTIKNINFLKVSLIEHTFVHVIPAPKGQNSPVLNECVWQTPLRYALQLDILILLQRIIEHFAAAAFALQANRSFDAVKIIVPSVIACIADVVMRKKATDIPSEVSLVLMGYERSHAYGFSTGKFGDQSETIEVHNAELNIARTSVLDYFADQREDVLPSNQIFCWENGNMPEESTARFLSEVCEVLAFDQNQLPAYVSGEQHLIIKNYPEFKCYRDISYYFKYFMNTEIEAFPPVNEWTQKEAQQLWKLGEAGYEVYGFGNMPLFCRPRKKPFTHRFPSTATPAFLTDPHPVRTEDDVLHIKNLPNFEDALGQRDSELLISYLTVPYLRLPLVLTFFSTEDRIHSLKSEKLRAVFDSVLFEPGRYLPAYLKDEPKDVPTTNPILLATPYGHLINELHRSPAGVISSMLKLLTLALDLDSGTVKASTLDIMLYVMHTASRFENYMAFMIDYANKRHASISGPLRDVTITPTVLSVLEDGIAKLRTILYGPVHKLLEEWVLEAMREAETKNDEKVLDENTKLACTLHAHLLLLYRNTRSENLNEDIVSTLLSGYIFLTTRHTWNMELLQLPETEMFELLAVQRRKLITWLRQCGQISLNVIMEAIMRVTTGTGIRKSQAQDVLRKWGFISGDRSIGRFTMVSADHKSGSVDGQVQVVSNEAELGVEIDIQTIQLTLKSSHLKALDRAIANDEDVVTVFGKHSMQAATIQSTEHREWVRLIGRDHDLQHWRTPDQRTDVQVLDRDYVPGELEETENWIIPIFEPVRLAYMVQPFELQICLPENPLPATADVAMMIGIHPKLGGTWKEIFVYKSRRSVQIYHVLSHGRRFYRSLEYTNDTRITLRDMQPTIDDRNFPWPKWERHGCGHPYNQHPNPLSVVITRDAAHPQNTSGTQEQFMPSRLLYGIVPSALLDTHMFWQDKSDNLRGYPTDDATHIIYVELQKMPKLQSTHLAGVSAKIRRIPKLANAEGEASGRASLTGSRKGNPKKRTIDQEELVLVDLLHAPEGTKLHSVAGVLARIERLSYVLAWTRTADINKPFNLDLVELPRLKMSFHAKVDHEGILRLFSMDHVNLFVTNERSQLTSDLIKGIPHSILLSDSNHEISILVPSIHPVRPFIKSSPFSTELVMNRADKKWYDALDTKYYLYPVHVSLSFLFTPTLASALYLLLLRFLHRQYSEAVRLANAIATDTHFTKEERRIFKTLRESLRDCHPNAHAARLKISLVTIDSPVVPPWDLTLQMARYVTKLPHVGVTCHIEHDEELQLLEHCILDRQDPRFNEKIHTVYDIILTSNRALYLRALVAGEKSALCNVVPRIKDSGWPYRMDMTALAAMPEHWRNLSLNYAPPMALSGQMLVNTIHQFWGGLETLAGNRLSMGFLFLYNLFTGSIKAKICSNDDSHSVASILSQLLADKQEYSILGSLLDILSRNPELCKKLPKYVDKRKLKNNQINGWGDDTEPVSPIDDLFSILIPTIVSEADSLNLPPDTHPKLPEPKNFVQIVPEGERDWIIPVLSDFMCEQRELRTVEKTGDTIVLDEELLSSFSTFPLKPIGLDAYIGYLTRLELNREPVSEQLPFDVSKHSQAHSEVAISMIQRLQADMKVYADLVNHGKTPKFTPVLDDYARSFVDHSNVEGLDKAIADVQKLLEVLNKLRIVDKEYVNKSIPYSVEHANAVPASDAATTESRRYELKRFCGMETFIWLDYLIGSLLSSKSVQDLQKLNPYFADAKIQHVYDVLVGTILHSNRAGQINRAMSDARDLLVLLQTAKARVHQKGDPATLAGLIQKGESLAVNLATKRHYIDLSSDNKRIYDPRFLVFEFTWNILLRESQVKLVREFMDALRNNRSLVKQMIMGAGKTTTVGPLLALMLGDGKSLVVQVVPPALLEFSRSVMRSTFSSIMHKRIYTLTSDRAAKVDQSMFKKLSNAVRTRGVVISTPTSIKSVQLKFLEMLHMLEDESMPHHPQMERDAAELGRVLALFRESVLIMDEVDLILHPLKSELNFPIGTKLDLDFHPLRWKLPIHLIDAVFYAERDRMAVGFRESHRALTTLAKLKEVIQEGYKRKVLQRNPHIVLLDPDFYHEYMKPIMAEWTLLWIESQNVSGVSTAQVLEYILAESADAISAELADIVNGLAPKHKKMLNLTRDWLRMYLPHILQKIDRVTFGILNKADYDRAIAEDPNMPRTRAKLGVPFVGKDVPSRSSEFAHPDIIIGLTVLAYRYEGLRWTDFNDIVANLRSTLTKEIGPWNERKSSLRYAAWVKEAGGKVRIARNYLDEPEKPSRKGKEKDVAPMDVDDDKPEVVPLRLLKRSNEDQMNKLFKLLYKLPDVIHWYLNEFIFPAYMRHQVIKLSSSGQELGGDMLFSRRIGFSGTPSDLIPIELGRCGYEKGSDGKMMAYLTSPEIVSYEVVEEGWSVRGLLERIATADPPYHALIDTGALITGMSNFEVAQYLLAHGLYGFEGVVFLDENDQKMILVRATNRVMKLAQCGISDKRRFAFYDQVHTTGMDIKHVLNAKAVLTLGKDMTFRDYSQGAFRMRGIGIGQTIHLYVIPEVERLMARELKEAALPDYGYTGTKKVLVEVAAWQVINSMRMERIQFNQLCLQNVANVYRKNSYKDLLRGHASFKVNTKLEDPHLRRCLQVFREPIDFSVEASVPKKREFEETIKTKIETYKHLIYGEEDLSIVNKVLEQVAKKRIKEEKTAETDSSKKRRRLATSLGHFFDAEQVQEQEQEREQQQEQEQEQEIEIEKYVDLAYSREQEEPTPWLFDTLRGNNTPQFYDLNEFHLYKRQPLKFEKYLKVSNNYFDKRWSGARRIKNVAMVLEWTPSYRQTPLFPPRGEDMPPKMEAALRKAFQHFDMDQSGDLNAAEVRQLVRAAVDMTPSTHQIDEILAEFGNPTKDDTLALDYDGVKHLLQSGKFREEQEGRNFVVLSLAEAETIRRIMHIRLEREIIDGTDVAMALRCIPAENSLIDISHQFSAAPHYMSEVAHQSLRFLDCDMHYKDPQLNVLLRALQNSTPRERVIFFQHVIGCRRRMNRKWEETPLAKVFGLPDEVHLLKQRAQAACMREGILAAGLPFYDAFRMFDSANIGLISAAGLWGAMDWLKIDMSAEDILDFMRTVDTKGDGFIDYRGFLDIVRDPDAKLIDLEDEIESEQSGSSTSKVATGFKFQKIEPKGEDLLQALRVRQQQEQKKLDEQEMEQERVYEQKIRREITEEEEEADRTQIGGPNPSIVRDTCTKFDFTTGRWPRGMTTRGDMAYKSEFDKKYLKVYRLGLMFLPLPLSVPDKRINQYTVTMEVMFDELPQKKAALFQTAQFNEDLAEIYVLSDGTIGIESSTPEKEKPVQLVPNEWAVVVVTVDCAAGIMTTYINGKLCKTIAHEEIGMADGRYSVGQQVCLFGSKSTDETFGANVKYMWFETKALSDTEIMLLNEDIQDEGSWECPNCTLRNKRNAIECSSCGHFNIQSQDMNTDIWACSVCTYRNPGGEVCAMCGSGKMN